MSYAASIAISIGGAVGIGGGVIAAVVTGRDPCLWQSLGCSSSTVLLCGEQSAAQSSVHERPRKPKCHDRVTDLQVESLCPAQCYKGDTDSTGAKWQNGKHEEQIVISSSRVGDGPLNNFADYPAASSYRV